MEAELDQLKFTTFVFVTTTIIFVLKRWVINMQRVGWLCLQFGLQEGIKLIQNEVTTLEEVGFLLLQEVEMSSSKYIFCNETSTPINKLLDANAWPKTRNNKNLCHPTTFKLSTHQLNTWKACKVLKPQVLPPLMFLL